MQSDVFETFVGAIVIAVSLGFLFYVYTSTDSANIDGYQVKARFSRIDGVTPGSDIRMSGIKIGTVGDLALDPTTYLAVVNMTIRSNVAIPDDSSVKVASESLLGGSYLNVEPGGSSDMLVAGDEIAFTQGPVDVMSLLSQAIFSLSSDTKKDEDK